MSNQRSYDLCERYPVALLQELRIDGLKVVYEERDVYDAVTNERIFPTLSRYERLHSMVSDMFFGYNRRLGCGISFDRKIRHHTLDDCHLKCIAFPSSTSIIHEDDIMAVLTMPEIGDADRFVARRDGLMLDRISSGRFSNQWFPSDMEDGMYGSTAGNSFMATRLFVLASSHDCVDRLATLAMLSI